MESEPDITCAACGLTRERPMARNGSRRIPAGWKCLGGRLVVSGVQARTVRAARDRAARLRSRGCDWPELRAALHTAFGETTRCANWLATQFYARDRQREPGDARLAAMPRVYLYPEARRLFPALASQTLASLEQQVLARYRATRLALVWRHAAACRRTAIRRRCRCPRGCGRSTVTTIAGVCPRASAIGAGRCDCARARG